MKKMKKIKSSILVLKVFGICLTIIIAFAGCGNKETLNTNQSQADQVKKSDNSESLDSKGSTSTSSKNDKDAQLDENLRISSDTSDKKESFNQFFFKDILAKKQYNYEGTVWGDNILEENRSEEVDDEGRVKVKANLIISEIAKLNKGKIYELDFSVNGAKNNTKEKGEKLYLWVTEDKIYYLSPSDNSDYKDLIENGQFNDLKYAKKLEESGKLPSTDKTLIRCSNDNINFNDGPWETEITIKDNTCTYITSHSGAGHYSEFVWEIGKGLTSYSWGYGAMREGIKLNLVD